MISYMIQSIVCAALLLAFYSLFLLKEKMNRFKRWYLLVALMGSFVIPLIPLQVNILPSAVSTAFRATAGHSSYNAAASLPAQSLTWIKNSHSQAPGDNQFLFFVYALVSMAFIVRTIWQLARFRHLTRSHRVEQSDGIRLILLRHGPLSFSFMRYICIAPTDINKQTGKPIEEIYLHELAHARQFHSIDILLISLIQALCWWNPFIMLYKKAIQLNHEFLADEAVLATQGAPARYQYLLLSRVQSKPTMLLGSTTIFSLTKKRFKMMTQKTSNRKVRLLQAAAACLTGLCLLALSQQGMAQDTSRNYPDNRSQATTKQKGVSPAEFDFFQKEMARHMTIHGKNTEWHFKKEESDLLNQLTGIYGRMSVTQRNKTRGLPPPPPPPFPPHKARKVLPGKIAPPPPPPPPQKPAATA